MFTIPTTESLAEICKILQSVDKNAVISAKLTCNDPGYQCDEDNLEVTEFTTSNKLSDFLDNEDLADLLVRTVADQIRRTLALYYEEVTQFSCTFSLDVSEVVLSYDAVEVDYYVAVIRTDTFTGPDRLGPIIDEFSRPDLISRIQQAKDALSEKVISLVTTKVKL